MSRPIYASDSNTITPLFFFNRNRPIFANTALKNECDFWIYFRIFFFLRTAHKRDLLNV